MLAKSWACLLETKPEANDYSQRILLLSLGSIQHLVCMEWDRVSCSLSPHQKISACRLSAFLLACLQDK